ncbi:MAG: hypothetical protein AAF757_24915 [Cyanobacteria bacterium P01_D01_bin.116]
MRLPASLCGYDCCRSAWAGRESRHPGRVGLAPTSLKQLQISGRSPRIHLTHTPLVSKGSGVRTSRTSEHHLLIEIETALINHFEPLLNGSELPFKKPRTTVTFEPEDYEELQRWASEEFRSVPQLILAIVKRALIERRERKQREENQ